MDGAGGVEMPRVGLSPGNNAALRHLQDVIAERLRHAVQGQGPVDEPLNKFETAHGPLLLVGDDTEAFTNRDFRHE